MTRHGRNVQLLRDRIWLGGLWTEGRQRYCSACEVVFDELQLHHVVDMCSIGVHGVLK